MRLILVLGIFCVAQVCSEVEELLDEDEQTCIVDSGVSENVVVEAKESFTVPAEDPLYKDFLSCCWKRYGYQKDNGEIEWDKIREVLKRSYKPAVAHKLVEKCQGTEGKTHGDTVALVLLCLDEHAPNLHALRGYHG